MTAVGKRDHQAGAAGPISPEAAPAAGRSGASLPTGRRHGLALPGAHGLTVIVMQRPAPARAE